MTAITRVSLPPANDDADYCAACLLLADSRIGAAMEALGDHIGALYGQRRTLTAVEALTVSRLRSALVALSHARALIEPQVRGRAS